MLSTPSQIVLQDIDYSPYLDEEGQIDLELEGKIGIYAIFNQEQKIEYVGYSRNLYKSLQQHLVRKIDQCYWLKVHLIERPNRSILEQIRHDWLTENNYSLSEAEEKEWIEPINVRQTMTSEEKAKYAGEDELNQGKILKKVARRVEEKIKSKLEKRGVTINLRFNPKLKEEGLLNLK